MSALQCGSCYARIHCFGFENDERVSKTTLSTRLTAAEIGRRMTLAEFDQAESGDGRMYELSRGIVSLVEVPHVRHFLQVDAIRRQLYAYQAEHPQ